MTDEKAIATKQGSADQTIQFGEGGMKLTNLQDAYRFAQYVVQAGMAPRGDREPAVVVKMAAALSLGLDPIWGLSNMTFTNGRIGIMGDSACAVVRARKLVEGEFPLVEYTGEPMTPEWTCRVGAVRKGYSEPVWSEFSLGDAVQAGLVKLEKGKLLTYKRDGGWGDHAAPWSRYPKRMLYYRALGFLVRDHFSDALMGAYVQEELADFPRPLGVDDRAAERDVTPPAEPDPLLASGADAAPAEPDESQDPTSNGEPPTGEEVVDGEWSDGESLVAKVALAIQEATTPAEIDSIRKAYGDVEWSDEDKATLRAARDARLADLAPDEGSEEPGQEKML